MSNREIEVRFLEIDKEALVKKLLELGAVDRGETLLEEVIIYDKDLKWRDDRKFIRLRKSDDSIKLTYKHHDAMDKGEAAEVEFAVPEMEKPLKFLEAIGYPVYRHQQKRRHKLEFQNVTFDIDTWPKIPTYVELEGESLEMIRKAAEAVGFDWSRAVYQDARWVIENIYKIPVGVMHWFTFDRCE